MKFRIGDKVRCIDDSMSSSYKNKKPYVKGTIYTIREFVSYRILNEFKHMYFVDGISDSIHEKSLESAIAENRNERLNKLGI